MTCASILPADRTDTSSPRNCELSGFPQAFFPVLGVQPIVGRAFRSEEDQPGTQFLGTAQPLPVATALRRRPVDRRQEHSAAQPALYSSLGVMPRGLHGDRAAESTSGCRWAEPGQYAIHARRMLTVIARRTGTLEQVRGRDGNDWGAAGAGFAGAQQRNAAVGVSCCRTSWWAACSDRCGCCWARWDSCC